MSVLRRCFGRRIQVQRTRMPDADGQGKLRALSQCAEAGIQYVPAARRRGPIPGGYAQRDVVLARPQAEPACRHGGDRFGYSVHHRQQRGCRGEKTQIPEDSANIGSTIKRVGCIPDRQDSCLSGHSMQQRKQPTGMPAAVFLMFKVGFLISFLLCLQFSFLWHSAC